MMLTLEEAVYATFAVVGWTLFVHFSFMPMRSPLDDATESDHWRQAIGMTIELGILAGVSYDNLLLSIGRQIVRGSANPKPKSQRNASSSRGGSSSSSSSHKLLKLLSWPRFIMHSALLPLNFLSLALLGQRDGVFWLQSDGLIQVIGIISAFLSMYGLWEVMHLKLQFATNGVARYRIDGVGAYLGVIVAIAVTAFAVIVGGSIILWGHQRDGGVLYGAILMFILAALPGRYGLLLANLGELFFIGSQIVAWIEG